MKNKSPDQKSNRLGRRTAKTRCRNEAMRDYAKYNMYFPARELIKIFI